MCKRFAEQWPERGFSTLELLIAFSLFALFFPLSFPTVRSFLAFQKEAAADEERNATLKIAENALLSAVYQSRSYDDLPSITVYSRDNLPKHIRSRIDSLPAKSRPADGSSVVQFLRFRTPTLARVEEYNSDSVPTVACFLGEIESTPREESLWLGVGIDGAQLYSGIAKTNSTISDNCAHNTHQTIFRLLEPPSQIVPIGLVNVQDGFVLYRDENSIFRRVSITTRENQPIIKGVKEFRQVSFEERETFASVEIALVAESSTKSSQSDSQPQTIRFDLPIVTTPFQIFL